VDLEAYGKSPNGSLERIVVEENGRAIVHAAFIPSDLPSSFELSQAT